MRHYAGLDVSVKETSVCIVDESGKVCRETKVPSHPEDLARALHDRAWCLERVGLEAGPLSQWLFSGLAASMLCSPPPATTLASSCAGSEGFCAPCCRRSSQRSRIHNRPKTGRTLLLHERRAARLQRSCSAICARTLSCSPTRLMTPTGCTAKSKPPALLPTSRRWPTIAGNPASALPRA